LTEYNKKHTIMKHLLYLLLAVITANLSMAQTSNLIVFQEDGEEFTLYLNGVEKNDSPKANVKVTGLEADFYKVKIAFNNKSMGTFTKSVWFEEKGKEYTFRIHQKNNGKYTLRPVSQTEITATTADEGEGDAQYEYPGNQAEESGQTTTETQSGSVTHHHTTTVEGGTSQGGESVHMNMNVNDSGMNVSVNDGEEEVNMDVNFEMDGDVSHSTTTSTTTSTTVTHSSSGSQTDYYESMAEENTETNVSSGGCDFPMGSTDFADAKASIESKTFDDSKLTLAKQIAKGNCLESAQVKEIMELLTYEDDKLEFAKFAYDYVHDPNRYYLVNDAFEFEMTIEELDEYLESH